MLSKPEKSFYLNIALLLLGAVSIFTGLALSLKPPTLMPFLMAMHIKSLHEWASYALTLLIMLHLIFHFDWIKAMTKNKFASKKILNFSQPCQNNTTAHIAPASHPVQSAPESRF